MSCSGIYHGDAAPPNASTRNKNKGKKNNLITATPSHSQWGGGEGSVHQCQVEKEGETLRNFSLPIFSKEGEGEAEKSYLWKKEYYLTGLSPVQRHLHFDASCYMACRRFTLIKISNSLENVNQSLHFSNHQKQQSSGYSLLGSRVLIYVVKYILFFLY